MQIWNLSSFGTLCLGQHSLSDMAVRNPSAAVGTWELPHSSQAICHLGRALVLTLSGAVVTIGRQHTQGVLCWLRGVDLGTL